MFTMLSQEETKHEESHTTESGGLWSDFLQESTCHGLKLQINSLQYRTRKYLWAVILLTSVSYLLYSLSEKTKEYFTYPIVTYTTTQTINQLPFPAVTICNANRKNFSKVSTDDRISNFWVSVGRMPFLSKKINWSDPFYEDNGFFKPQTIENITAETMDIDDFIIFSSFDDTYRLNFGTLMTEEGFCYTFNSDGAMTTSNYGALNNLLLVIDINQEHYGLGQDLTAGIKVVLHDAQEIPDIYNEGFYIGPGVSALASVHVSKYTYLSDPFYAFGDSKCHKGGVNKNPLRPLSYSVAACQKVCKAKETFKACNCINVDDVGNETYCSLYQYKECYIPRRRYIYRKMTECYCPLPCEVTKYVPHVSQLTYPSEIAGHVLQSVRNETIEHIRKNQLQLRIFFESLQIVRVDQLPMYNDFTDILGNLGGQMGLCIGASIFTFLEFLEFCVIFLCHCCRWVYKKSHLHEKGHKVNRTEDKQTALRLKHCDTGI